MCMRFLVCILSNHFGLFSLYQKHLNISYETSYHIYFIYICVCIYACVGVCVCVFSGEPHVAEDHSEMVLFFMFCMLKNGCVYVVIYVYMSF